MVAQAIRAGKDLKTTHNAGHAYPVRSANASTAK